MTTQKQLSLLELQKAAQETSAQTVNGTGVDLAPYINSGGRQMKAVLSAEAVSGTTPTLDVKIQESDSLGSGYTDISGAAFTQLTTSDGLEEIHFRTNKRYVRMSYTTGGTSPVYNLFVGLLVEKRMQ